MGLLNPALFAASAACVAIPILIHLLMRRRRKPVRWAAMRFLAEAYRRNRKRLLIERWLLLALRCLALLLLAVAIGRPALRAAGLSGPGSKTVYLLIDDSLTATAVGAGGAPGMDRHARTARDLIESLDPMRGDRVALISMSRPARGVVLGPSADLGAVVELIDSMQTTDARADLAGAVQLVLDDIATAAEGDELESAASGGVVVAMISDWLEGTARGDAPLPAWPEQAPAEFIIAPPLEAPPATVSLTEVSPVRGVTVGDDVGGDRVRLSLARSSDQQATTRVLVRGMTGPQSWSPPLGEAVVRWDQGQTTAQTMVAFDPTGLASTGTGGWAALRAEIDADALPGDDVRYAALQVRGRLSVGLASSVGLDRPVRVTDYHPAQWAALALLPGGESSAIELRNLPVAAIERERLSDLAAVIVVEPARVSRDGWQRLGEFVTRGGLLVLSPDADEAGTPVWPAMLNEVLELGWSAAGVDKLDPPATIAPARVGPLLTLLSPELDDIASTVPVRRRLSVRADDDQVQLSLSDGTPLVVAGRGNASRGLVVMLTAALDLDWTDLPARGLMVPLMQELVRQGIDAASPRAVSIAGGVPAVPPGTEELQAPGRDRLRSGDAQAARHAGVWTAVDERGATTGFAIVNPDAEAGRAGVRALEDIAGWFETQLGRRPSVIGRDDPTERAATDAPRTDAGWALPAIVLLLIALVTEALLARRFSHAVSASAPASTGGVR